jgi:hypothetical protein
MTAAPVALSFEGRYTVSVGVDTRDDVRRQTQPHRPSGCLLNLGLRPHGKTSVALATASGWCQSAGFQKGMSYLQNPDDWFTGVPSFVSNRFP